jgi:hypothetical protein
MNFASQTIGINFYHGVFDHGGMGGRNRLVKAPNDPDERFTSNEAGSCLSLTSPLSSDKVESEGQQMKNC